MNSATRKPIDDCARLSTYVAPYLDGELDADHALDLEGHLVSCDCCTERVTFLRATRQSLKRAATQKAPSDLCARMRATIEAERARARTEDESDSAAAAAATMAPKLLRLRYAVGLAAAAGVVFAMGMSRYFPSTPRNVAQVPNDFQSASAVGFDHLLDELIALHARPLPPETTDMDQVPRFDPLLGVQVRRPPFQPFGAIFKGARIHPVADRGSLLQLYYNVPGGKHVTMYVFDPRVVPVEGTRLERRVVSHRAIMMGRLRGYSVAAAEQRGVGYAFASDLDTDESTKMVIAALQE